MVSCAGKGYLNRKRGDNDYVAAAKLQAAFRSLRVQNYMRGLRCVAIYIQSRWRGFSGRLWIQRVLFLQVTDRVNPSLPNPG